MQINYNQYADQYDSRYSSELCLLENSMIKKALNDIKEISTRKFVDLGCGTGFLLDLLENNSILSDKYIGIDVSNEMITQAQKKYPKYKFYIDDARMITNVLKENDFVPDIAISFFSIPYIGVETIENIYDILPNHGIFLTVYYSEPYLNSSSVYYEKKDHYLNNVLPQVHECISCADKLFKKVYSHNLVNIPTYIITLYEKIE